MPCITLYVLQKCCWFCWNLCYCSNVKIYCLHCWSQCVFLLCLYLIKQKEKICSGETFTWFPCVCPVPAAGWFRMGEKPLWEQIGSSFVQHYYQLFDTDRTQLGSIYVSFENDQYICLPIKYSSDLLLGCPFQPLDESTFSSQKTCCLS